VDRVERGHRVLEDEPDAPAADVEQLLLGEREQVVSPRWAVPVTRPGGIGISLVSASVDTDLPDPDSPTIASVSPRCRS
jgi:hypothetical protein